MPEYKKDLELEDLDAPEVTTDSDSAPAVQSEESNAVADNALGEASNEPVTADQPVTDAAPEAAAEPQNVDAPQNSDSADSEAAKPAADTPASESMPKSAEAAAPQAESPKPASENKPAKRASGVSRGDLLKKRLVDQYKADKGGDSEPEAGEKKQEGKLEKAAKFGGVLEDLAENYDNSKSIGDNASKVGEAFKKVYGGKSGENKNEGEKENAENNEAENNEAENKKSGDGAPKTDVDKAADKAVKEIVQKGDKETGSEESLQKVVKEVSKSEEETAPKDKNEAEKEKNETKQEKSDKLVGEAAVAIHDKAVEAANKNSEGEKSEGSEDKGEKEAEKEGEKKEEETPLPVKEMLADLSGGYKNTVSAVSSLYSAKRSNSRRNKVRGRYQGAQHITGAVGNAAGLVSTLLGSGKVGTGKGIDIATGTLGAVSGGMEAASAILGLVGDKTARKHAAQIADKTGSLTKDTNKYAALKNTSEDVRKLKALKSKTDPEKYEKDLAEAKKKRDSAKANKLAMAIASKFNKNKSETSNKGFGGLVSGVGKMWEGISNATGIAGGGFIKDILSPVIKKGVEFAKEKLDERDKQNEEKEKQKDDSTRLETINEYLAGKRERIKAQAKGLSSGQDLSDEEREALSGDLTDNEADKIALMRLGVSVSDMSSDKPASDSEMMDGFEKVIMKRANNILRSYNKDEMLDALMLSHDATAEDIAKALKGE